jgi:hypothetical protein
MKAPRGPLDPASSSAYALNRVSSWSQSACVAVGERGSTPTSVDGGATWAARVSGTAATLFSVACVGSGFCVAMGEETTAIAICWTPTLLFRPAPTAEWVDHVTSHLNKHPTLRRFDVIWCELFWRRQLRGCGRRQRGSHKR